MNASFQEELKTELLQFLSEQYQQYPSEELLRIDLHCHDHNSDVPDELMGRILNVPETWLPSDRLITELKKNKCEVFTITNHNNARSCFKLKEEGQDVLVAAEFSCWVPDFSIGIHVLTYGFTKSQEIRLNKLRKNIYAFQEYCHQNNIPTIWAHPLYHYAVSEMPGMDFFNKMVLLFERFEVLNGQRDTWQNMLMKAWLEQLTPGKIDEYAKSFSIDPRQYCKDPYRKVFTGGSDCHMGIFAGTTGSYLHVPNLRNRMKEESISELALEAIRNGMIIPYGSYQQTEKITIAFLNYVCQVAMNYKDPGLIRLLLHKGSTKDKMLSLLVGNAFNELQNHRVTMSFVKLFHKSLLGKSPSFWKKHLIPSVYKPIFEEAAHIAKQYKKGEKGMVRKYYKSIIRINNELNNILFSRLDKKIEKSNFLSEGFNNESVIKIIEALELPSNIRSYLDGKNNEGSFNVSNFLDGLSFPFFASTLILSAHFASAKALFHTRPFLTKFSESIHKYRHPKRILWMTDTFEDKNGVSFFLKELHRQIVLRDLPIDLLVCSSTLESADHLRVLAPIAEYTIPKYEDQKIRVPNFMELHNAFQEGEYDRIVCSTEGIMGAAALYLKHAYSVEANFYMHTDWLMFAQKVLRIKGHNRSRVQRILRAFYQSYDRVFVLNSDQKKWLTGQEMNLSSEVVFQTSHWTNKLFEPKPNKRKELFGVSDEVPVMLYVGRLSAEKGVLELIDIYEEVRKVHTQVKLVVVGAGPEKNALEGKLPDAQFIAWVDQDELPAIYSSSDLLLLPSWFDTFCNVVLESLSCALPVIAYNTKGPKDILIDQSSGFLVNNKLEMIDKAKYYLSNTQLHTEFKKAAMERSKAYTSDKIIDDFLTAVLPEGRQ